MHPPLGRPRVRRTRIQPTCAHQSPRRRGEWTSSGPSRIAMVEAMVRRPPEHALLQAERRRPARAANCTGAAGLEGAVREVAVIARRHEEHAGVIQRRPRGRARSRTSPSTRFRPRPRCARPKKAASATPRRSASRSGGARRRFAPLDGRACGEHARIAGRCQRASPADPSIVSSVGADLPHGRPLFLVSHRLAGARRGTRAHGP